MSDRFDSASDARTANNVVRHHYRVLTDAEKAAMAAVKDKGAELIVLIRSLDDCPPGVRPAEELETARRRVEEAVMWAVKHITA